MFGKEASSGLLAIALSGGMVFPHFQIEETLRQENRDLTRFDLDFDLAAFLRQP
jgi:hypothetical protein